MGGWLSTSKRAERIWMFAPPFLHGSELPWQGCHFEPSLACQTVGIYWAPQPDGAKRGFLAGDRVLAQLCSGRDCPSAGGFARGQKGIAVDETRDQTTDDRRSQPVAGGRRELADSFPPPIGSPCSRRWLLRRAGDATHGGRRTAGWCVLPADHEAALQRDPAGARLREQLLQRILPAIRESRRRTGLCQPSPEYARSRHRPQGL